MKAFYLIIQENIEEIKKTQAEIKADQEKFKAEMREQFKTITDTLNEVLPKPADNNQHTIIFGGMSGQGLDKVSKTVEKFNLAKGKSTKLPPMNKPRIGSASFVHNGKVIVTGGYDGQDALDSIEILNMKQQPLQWKMLQRCLLSCIPIQ